jgi:hypothetical protein
MSTLGLYYTKNITHTRSMCIVYGTCKALPHVYQLQTAQKYNCAIQPLDKHATWENRFSTASSQID